MLNKNRLINASVPQVKHDVPSNYYFMHRSLKSFKIYATSGRSYVICFRREVLIILR